MPDSQTLVITLNAPAPYFLQALCYPTAYAQPEQLIQKYGSQNWTTHLTDNGGFGGNLYKVSVWDHKGNLDLVRNASFWGTAPKLSHVDFKIYQTVNAEYSDYLAGSLEVGFAPPAQYKSVQAARSDFHEQPFLAISYYQPNWAKASLQQPRRSPGFRSGARQDGAGQPGQPGSGDCHQPYRAPGHVWL